MVWLQMPSDVTVESILYSDNEILSELSHYMEQSMNPGSIITLPH